jgi:hypothetical protein
MEGGELFLETAVAKTLSSGKDFGPKIQKTSVSVKA